MNVPGLLITSGKGGVGKTLISTNIAVELSKSIRVALVDADIRAPNLTYVMGVQDASRKVVGRKLFPFQYNANLQIFSTDHFFHEADGSKKAIMPTGEEVRQIIHEAYLSVQWDNPEIFIIDSDPSTGDVYFATRDVFREMLTAIVVSTNDLSSLLDCERTINALMIDDIYIMSVVGNMIWDGDDSKVRELASRYGLHFAGSIPFENHIRTDNNNGRPGLVGTEIIETIVDNILHRKVA